MGLGDRAKSGDFGSVARTAAQEQLRAQDVGVARIEGEHCVAVAVISDWSFLLDPDPLHGPHLSIQATTFSRNAAGGR